MKQRSLPELNDEFANSVREGLTYDELYKEVRSAVSEEGDRRNKEKRNIKIEEALVGIIDCEIPDTLITEQAKEKFAMMMADQREAGVSDEEIKKMITKVWICLLLQGLNYGHLLMKPHGGIEYKGLISSDYELFSPLDITNA